MPFQIIFIKEENAQGYKEAVLTWLKADFSEQGEPPSGHFWHNRGSIGQAFDQCTAMVALSEKNEVVGYMIWSMGADGSRAAIDIVEVKKNYRQQGIFSGMLTALSNKFTSLVVLSAHPLPQARRILDKLNWDPVLYDHKYERRFKTIKPVAQQLDTLPNGRAIAVFSQADVLSSEHIDFYVVQAKPDEYSRRMKYFQITVDESGKLLTPVVTHYDCEGYVGIYFNQKLLAEGKAKHLFENAPHDPAMAILLCIADRVKLRNPERFPKEFFLQPCQKEVGVEIVELPSSEGCSYAATVSSSSSSTQAQRVGGDQRRFDSEPPKKTPCHEVSKVDSKELSVSQTPAPSAPSVTQTLAAAAMPPSLDDAPILTLPISQPYGANPNLLFSGGGDKGEKVEVQLHGAPQIVKH